MRKLLCLGVLAGLTSCHKEHQAGLMLEISSELSTPADIDSVRLQIVHATRGEVARTDLPMSATLTETFPFTFSVGPSQTNKEGPYTFRLLGMLKGRVRTVREAITDVPRSDMRSLTMAVEFLCYDKVKTLDNGDVVGLCPAGQTCIAGECKPVPVYKTEELPIYAEGPKGTDSGATCYDAVACFSSPVLLFPNRTTCRVPKPVGAQNFTVGLLLPTDKPGVPFQGKKLIVFDTDGVAAWRDAGTEVQLPSGICTIMNEYPDAVLMTATTCANKKSTVPLCKVPPVGADASVFSPLDAGTDGGPDVTLLSDVSGFDGSSADVQTDAEFPELGTTSSDVGLDVAPPGECEAIGGGFHEAGVSCDGGVCNGTGRCGQCRPGEHRCSGQTPQTCTAEGVWSSGTDCLSVCIDGVCSGICAPGLDKQCKNDNKVLQTCDATGHYVDAETCQYVCSQAACSGECKPGEMGCLGTTPRVCSASGQWVGSTACPYLCSGGTCTGVCKPGERRCSGTTPQVCTPSATWQSEAPCSYACTATTGTCEQDNVICWGNNDNGQSTPPLGSHTLVSAGTWHTCSVRTSGTAICWGGNDSGQATPPLGVFDSVSARELHTCGVRTNGSVECWGVNVNGQATPKPGLYSSVSAGDLHTCGVHTNGSVECWGDNTYGQSTPKPGLYSLVSAGGERKSGV